MLNLIDQDFANIGTFGLLLNTVFCWIEFIGKIPILNKINRITSTLSATLLGVSLSLRWFNEGYFPLSNLYESLLFLSFCLTCGYLILEKNTKTKLISILITPISLLIACFATLTLPTDMQKALPLVPALQSNWLMMHVSMMMLSYSILLLGSLLCILYFTLNKIKTDKKNLLQNLDSWSYRTIGLGFPLLTIGIIAGAVWANEAWGSYWSWDPKETWALITWLNFAIYLHARIVKGWNGEKVALIGSLGFLTVWICYLGVNFLGKGLHSYGWVG